MKKLLTFIVMALITLSAFSCHKKETIMASNQKSIARIEKFKQNMPKDYQAINYQEKALEYDRLVYDFTLEGTYLPLIWLDNIYQTYGIAAYVGDPRHGIDGSQEAVTNIASVLSASLLGVDKTDQNGYNYVRMLNAFYSEDESIILNNPSGLSQNTSLWYLIYPAILYAQVSLLYEEEQQMRINTLNTIESWYQAAVIMFDSEYLFDYSHFNFITMEPYRNNIWREPDSAVGISMLMYLGYQLTNDNKYKQMAIDTLNYIDNSFFGSPMYELLLFYGPYLASCFNEQFGTSFKVEKFFDKIFDGNSIPRGGWGMITGSYGNYPVDGLIGSITDGGGYAFSMNGFVAAYAISKAAYYVPNYAEAIGKWLLHLVGNSRYFFPDQSNVGNQSIYQTANKDKALAFNEIASSNIPYEGIRKVFNAKTPWFGGDPTAYGWAETDMSLYSGAHVGLLASIVSFTDVEGILKIDLTKGLYEKEYNSYLLYNPHNAKKKITYHVDNPVDLYDKVQKIYLAKDVSNSYSLTLNPNQAVVVVELPKGEQIVKEGIYYYIDNQIFDKDFVNIVIANLKANEFVGKEFKVKMDYYLSNPDDEISYYEVSFEGKLMQFETNNFTINATTSGGKQLIIKAYFESGLTDTYEIRIRIK